jgi:capsular polysaccharide biosynthesis protein
MHPMISIYIQAVKRAMPLLLLAALVLAASGYLLARSAGPVYEVHYSYLVSLKTRDQVPEYRFDGYYALQATDLFTATLARWTTTPEVIVAALNEGGISPVPQDAQALSRYVRSEKTAPQLVEVTVTGSSAAKAQRLAAGLQKVMEKNIASYHDAAIPAVDFSVVTTNAWTGVSQLHAGLVVLAIAVTVLFVGINIVLLATSVKYWE